MKSRHLFWMLICWAFVTIEGLATTVRPRLIRCPICTNTLVAPVIGSWFQGSEPDRDFAGSLFAAQCDLDTCPQCLFTTVKGGFANVSPAEAAAIRPILPMWPKHVAINAPLLLTNSLTEPEGPAEFILRFRIAELCEAQRQTNVARLIRLTYAGYYQTRYRLPNEVKSAMAKEVIGRFEHIAGFAEERSDQEFCAYMAGELSRQAGDFSRALRWLEPVAAGKYTDGLQKESLVSWAREQADLARRRVSAGRAPAPESDLSTETKQKLLKDFPSRLKALSDGEPEASWKVAGDEGNQTLWAVESLAEEGNPNALEFLAVWLGRLTVDEVEDQFSLVCSSLNDLATQRELLKGWPQGAAIFKEPLLKEAVQYAIQGGAWSGKLHETITAQDNNRYIAAAVIGIAAARRDESVKPLLINRMEAESDPTFAGALEAYFKAVGTTDDLKALTSFAKQLWPDAEAERGSYVGFIRRDFEALITNIRFRTELTRMGSSNSHPKRQ